jgi:tRNA nucleotidyltransferase (CCA-adding enzyme)
MTKSIDDAIKTSRVSILAYMHTSAAHYIAIEYNEEIDMFIVYNDSFAQTRSTTLGLTNTNPGAAIDSVSALITNTRSILFTLSLIVVS